MYISQSHAFRNSFRICGSHSNYFVVGCSPRVVRNPNTSTVSIQAIKGLRVVCVCPTAQRLTTSLLKNVNFIHIIHGLFNFVKINEVWLNWVCMDPYWLIWKLDKAICLRLFKPNFTISNQCNLKITYKCIINIKYITLKQPFNKFRMFPWLMHCWACGDRGRSKHASH